MKLSQRPALRPDRDGVGTGPLPAVRAGLEERGCRPEDEAALWRPTIGRAVGDRQDHALTRSGRRLRVLLLRAATLGGGWNLLGVGGERVGGHLPGDQLLNPRGFARTGSLLQLG